MSPHIKKIKKFMAAFGEPKQASKALWELYEAGINSELANGWDENKRATMFYFVKTLSKFFFGFAVLYELTEGRMAKKEAGKV